MAPLILTIIRSLTRIVFDRSLGKRIQEQERESGKENSRNGKDNPGIQSQLESLTF